MSDDDDTKAAQRARAERLHAEIDRLAGREQPQPAAGSPPEAAAEPAVESEEGESLRDLINDRARELPGDGTPPEE